MLVYSYPIPIPISFLKDIANVKRIWKQAINFFDGNYYYDYFIYTANNEKNFGI